mmetsp:Transcript_10834/g.17014  ORF Transcript_10834/g.17014 Transcript_10834/m.17014 type:complete len:213 (+) Transcript_10834:315-953(+)
MGDLSKDLSIDIEGTSVVVSSHSATQLNKKRVWSRKATERETLSSRYVKYLTRKFIKKIELKYFIKCISVDFSNKAQADPSRGIKFQIKYTNVHKDKKLKVRLTQMFGTKLEAARRAYFEERDFDDYKDSVMITTRDMLLLRKVKSTQQYVGGEEWVQKNRKTVGEYKAEADEKLKHWVELQRQSIRVPLGGAMFDWRETSILKSPSSCPEL